MSASVVQHVPNTSAANANTVAATISASVAGHPLFIGAGNGDFRTVAGIVDNKGNSYLQATGAMATKITGGRTDVWFCLAPTAGVTTVTITFSGIAGTYQKEIYVWEVSGLGDFPRFLTAAAVSDQTGVGTTETGAAVTTVATTAGIAIAIVRTDVSIVQNPKAGNAFTAGGNINSFTNAGCAALYLTAGMQQPVWVSGASGDQFLASTAAFDSATTPPPTPGTPRLIRRSRRFALPFDRQFWMYVSRMEFTIQSGVGNTVDPGAEPLIEVRFSGNGGKTWGPIIPVWAGEIGEYFARPVINRIGKLRNGYCEIAVSDPVFWAFLEATIDAEESTA